MNLNVFNGTVASGSYNAIIVHGEVAFESGVVFKTLTVYGTVTLGNCTGRYIKMNGGCLRCTGSMSVGILNGHGTIDVSGTLQCSTMRFTGDVRATGLHTNKNLTLRGAAEAEAITAGGSITIVGKVSARHMRTKDLIITTLHTTMLQRFHMDNYLGHSTVGTIEASCAQLHATTCDRAIADLIKLKEGSYVSQAFYGKDLTYDATSDVGSITCTAFPARKTRELEA